MPRNEPANALQTSVLQSHWLAPDPHTQYLLEADFDATIAAYAAANPSVFTPDLAGYQTIAEKGTANGYASLDNSGKVPAAQLPTRLVDWSTIVNTPTTLAGYGITDAQPLDADLTAIAALTGTGIAGRTGVDTWALSPLVANRIPVAASGATLVDSASLTWDTVNSALVVGTDPGGTSRLRVSGAVLFDTGTGTDASTALSPALALIRGADGVQNRLIARGWGFNGINIVGQAIGGTRAVPAATVSGAQFVGITAFGFDGTAYSTGGAASIGISADGTWSATNRGTFAVINGTSNGSTAGAEWRRWQNAQELAPDGTVAAPADSWLNDPDTGFYRIGANNVGLSLGGARIVDFSNGAVVANYSGSAPPVTPVGTVLVGPSAANATWQGQSYGGATLFIGYRTNGTPGGALTGVAANDNVTLIGAAGRTSTGLYTGSNALIALFATETYISGTNTGTAISFATTFTGEAARNIDLTIRDRTLVIADARDVVLGTGTGTKWGQAANQKQAWWGATPVVQPSGYGTPTNGSITANFPGLTASLLQTSQTLAALLQHLLSIGLIGV